MDDDAFLHHDHIGRTGADVGKADAQLALVAAQNGVGRGQRFEDGIVHVNARAVERGDDVLRRAGGRRADVHLHFQPRGHHADGIVNAVLVVEDVLLRQQVQDLAVGWQRDGAGAFHGEADILARDLARAPAERDAAAAVHAPQVCARHAGDGVLHGHAARFFDLGRGLLHRRDGLFQVNDHALARSARLGDRMSVVAQPGVGGLGHQHARF